MNGQSEHGVDEGRRDTISTYRHLRLGMALLLALLLGAVGLRVAMIDGNCFEGSISAYYFTSVRAVFVAALCALGACLIVYRGNTDGEDIALNASGALAFIVAFVPTKPPTATDVTCSASNVPAPGELEAAVTNNVLALLGVGAVALVVAGALILRSQRLGFWPRASLSAFAAVLVATAIAFALWPDGFRAHAHSGAAIAMFLGILAVVCLNARDADTSQESPLGPVRYRNTYYGFAIVMLTTLVVLGFLHSQLDGWRHGVLWIEAALLLEFLVFWIVQTRELWEVTRRVEMPNPG